MTNKSLIFAGIFAAILGNNAFATGENTVTSKSYVDAQDALKQNKIPAAGTNAETLGESVVTYTDTAGTIGERGIYSGKGKVGAGDLITVDVVAGGSGTVAVRDENGMPTSSRYIYDGSNAYSANDDADSLITAGAVQGQIDASVTNVNNQITYVTDQITNVNNQVTNVNNNIADVAAALSSQNVQKISVQLPLICANEECNLWTVTGNSVVHKIQTCSSINDCPACETGFLKTCTGGRTKYCGCVYGGCNTVADCPACGPGTKAACENNICKCNVCKADGVQASSASECCSGDARQGICCSGDACGSR